MFYKINCKYTKIINQLIFPNFASFRFSLYINIKFANKYIYQLWELI